jgi:D-alanyl-D-alanine dipeptidase
MPICENHEPLVDLADAVPEVELVTGHALARTGVAERIRTAQASLPAGYKLRIQMVHRSLAEQVEMYNRFHDELTQLHPEWPLSQVRRELNKFVAPPNAKHPPGHTTGGAVDLTLVGPDGEPLDMNSAIREGIDEWLVLPTYSRYITPRAAGHREMLVRAMTGAGFSSYSSEWWHYSYGDSGWAVRVAAPCAVYGAGGVEGIDR